MEKLGAYEIRGERGRGAAATVYDAFNPRLSRRVALKVVAKSGTTDAMQQHLLARFRQEARITAALNHPGVVAVYDFDETPECAFLAMEFVDGESLKERLDREGPLPVARAVEVMVAVLRTLDYCHQAGVIHRDIKPSNLMLPRAGGVKLADFGIARPEYQSVDTLVGTQFGTWLGTPPYMSPEQFTAQTPVGSRSDIWSCGVVLFELLTGQRPFRGDANAIAYQVVNAAPPAVRELKPELPAALAGALQRALAKRPQDRFATAGAFADALAAALQTAPAPAPAPHALARHRPWRRYALAALIVVLLVSAAAQLASQWRARQEQMALEAQIYAVEQRRRDEQARQRAAQAAEAARQQTVETEARRARELDEAEARRRAAAAELAHAEAQHSKPPAAMEAPRSAPTLPSGPPSGPGSSAISSWDHNGSVMVMETTGAQMRIWYLAPRAGMASVGVQRGTVLFSGTSDGTHVAGTAHVFKSGCDPAPYPVSGTLTEARNLELTGAAPIWARDPACAIARYDPTVSDGRLRFSFLSQDREINGTTYYPDHGR